MQAEIFDGIRGLLEMGTGLGVSIPVLPAGEGAVSTADQIEQVFTEFDIVGAVVDALGAVGFLHGSYLLCVRQL